MDYAALPPEINSARMYTGPGSGPMLAAATAWDGLAAALHSAASSYQSEVAALTAGPWLGPASALMAAAAAPYLAWTRSSATQAEQTANQAKAAATAYETAFAETVPPPVITANRSLLMALVATNIFGQNTPAIATTEAQYAEMWAQDAAAMYGYAGASAAATTLTPFSPPPQSTNSGGPATQAAAVTQAAGASAGNVQSTVSSVPQAISAVPAALTSLAATPAQALSPLDLINLLGSLSGILVDSPLSAAGLAADSTLVNGPALRRCRYSNWYPHGRHRQRLGGDTDLAGQGAGAALAVPGDHESGRWDSGVGGPWRGENDWGAFGSAGLDRRDNDDTAPGGRIAGDERRRGRRSLRRQRGEPVQSDGPGRHGRSRDGRYRWLRRRPGPPGADRGAHDHRQGGASGNPGRRPDHERRRRVA